MRYEIEQYEIHIQKVEIDADSEAEAIQKTLEGEAEDVKGTLDYVEVHDGYGMSVKENSSLTQGLIKLGIIGDDDSIVPSIASVTEIINDGKKN